MITRSWHCPECGKTDQTRDDGTGQRWHTCPKLRGLAAPMVLAGVKAKLELREREDYVGDELVQRDPELRRPVMSIVTTRDHGQDTVVLAPTARANARS